VGRQQKIHAKRDRKLEAARRQRQSRRQQAGEEVKAIRRPGRPQGELFCPTSDMGMLHPYGKPASARKTSPIEHCRIAYREGTRT
jgi:hypothetical protein